MIYLTSTFTQRTLELADERRLGLLVQPRMGSPASVVTAPRAWAADNDCFNAGETFDLERFLLWLEPLRVHAGRCLFVPAPDVVGDAPATLARAPRPLAAIRELGFPAALVAQDGLEALSVPWDAFDCLFIGGSTEWKLSAAAAGLIGQARDRGKWVHVGRVNSRQRFGRFRRLQADSADGTYLAFGPDTNLPKLMDWVEPSQLDLFA